MIDSRLETCVKHCHIHTVASSIAWAALTLIKKFYSNWTCTDFLQDHSVPFYDNNMMLCGAYRLTLYKHEDNIYPAPQRPVFVNPPNSLIRQIFRK